ncbi:MAG: N-formylglutamate deformylase [Steroidobacteraceae bacterium]
MSDWLSITPGDAPLLLSMPHSGLDLGDLAPRLVSPWRARKDADWHLPQLYAFGEQLGATIVRTSLSRTVIDVNRDPSGRSLYPGRATTELCPTTTFDGEPLYIEGQAPSAQEIAQRRRDYFDPYHAALRAQAERLLARHRCIVMYDCHSIRSSIPRLFEGQLPQFNIGTNDEAACDPRLSAAIVQACAESDFSHVLNGRFKGGYITRSFGNPARGLHAVQMELACRGYLREPSGSVTEAQWPVAFDAAFAAPLQAVLQRVLQRCIEFATRSS